MLDDRQDLRGHLLYDLVRIAIWHETGQRTVSSHAESSRVVDHDQINAASLFAFGGNPGPGPATDDRLTAINLVPKTFQNLFSTFHDVLRLPFLSHGSRRWTRTHRLARRQTG